MNPALLISTGRAAGNALKSVGGATVDVFRTAKEVAYDPVTGALESAVRTDIGDVIEDIQFPVIGSLDKKINAVLVFEAQDAYDEIKKYSLADMVEAVFGGASDSVGVQHGRGTSGIAGWPSQGGRVTGRVHPGPPPDEQAVPRRGQGHRRRL